MPSNANTGTTRNVTRPQIAPPRPATSCPSAPPRSRRAANNADITADTSAHPAITLDAGTGDLARLADVGLAALERLVGRRSEDHVVVDDHERSDVGAEQHQHDTHDHRSIGGGSGERQTTAPSTSTARKASTPPMSGSLASRDEPGSRPTPSW